MIILLSGDAQQIAGLNLTPWERNIVNMKQMSPAEYRYSSLESLKFEMNARTRIVQSARALQESGASFSDFKRSKCNEQFWMRTNQGGFRLKSGVSPADGINDIFQNGRLYAFECATAIVIVMYKAILDLIDRNTFNTYFQDLLLYTWYYDNDLRFNRTTLPEAYPGDVLYFNNPDFDPATPGWRGENAVLLGPDLFYGHGPGIRSSAAMIAILNSKRKPGSLTSAYLIDEVLILDFEHIRKLKEGAARIGTRKYMLR
ncbi:protein-glutamine gamma-glutamyltransferase [Paenibacillus caui]|uniref:protein-glutamine gamma-glutamyltransferase n=1 Tax=Paenibacillus caui TaxID=2873927 RepID=UPI001CAA1A90|nr:protein-glutamine gamma-glutamyltransferase [Paenibacillus caui]